MTKKAYIAEPDVAWVNGAKVSDDRTVHLTDAEAAFDLGLGRIMATVPVAEAQTEELPERLVEPEAGPQPRAGRKKSTDAAV